MILLPKVINLMLKKKGIKYFLDVLGIIVLEEKGKEWYAKCPNPDHYDKSPSWSINADPTDKKFGWHNCWSCDYNGNIITLIASTKGISYRKAEEWFKKQIQGDIDTGVLENTAINEKFEDEECEDVKTHIHNMSFIHLPKQYRKIDIFDNDNKYLKYLLNRGIPRSLISYYDIGYCDYGYYGNRIIIPFEIDSKRVSFFARSIIKTINKKKKGWYPKGPAMGNLLWPLDDLDLTLGYVIIVEGAIDALRLMALGYKNVLCAFGAKISDEQVELLVKKLPKHFEVILMPDGDGDIRLEKGKWVCTKGKLMVQHGYEKLRHKFKTTLVDLPEGTDPGDVKPKALKRALRKRRRVSMLSTVERKINYNINK